MMAHRDRLNALAAAELGRARPAETQVEISLTPANDAKGDDSSPAVRVTVNDVLGDRGTEISLSDDSFDDNGRSSTEWAVTRPVSSLLVLVIDTVHIVFS